MVGQMDRREGLAFDAEARGPMPPLDLDTVLRFADIQARHPTEPSATTRLSDTTQPLHFRNYSLLPGARLLLRSGEPVALGGRAFDLLYILIQARGRVVERAELMRGVWPTTIVEESNLRFQVACVRKALDADRDLIKSVAGRGYVFVTEPEDAAGSGRGPDPFEAEPGPDDFDRPAPVLSRSPLPRDPAGAQTPEDYRAACELLRELLNSVLHELRELRGAGPPRSAMSPPSHIASSD